MTYLEAYRNRMKANHENFVKIGKELIEMGYDVLVFKHAWMINTMKVLDKNGKGVVISFYDAPHRFQFEYNIDPSERKGSGFTGTVFYPEFVEELPFTVDDVVSNLKEMYSNSLYENLYVKLEAKLK